MISWKRIVIKVGSALISPNRKGCSTKYLSGIANFITECRQQGVEVVLVSSGSVAAGAQLFSESDRSATTIKKAMAAAGQTAMMATWDSLFDFPSAQILLSQADLCERDRYVSIRETIFSLLEHNIIPIVNENDTVTCDETKVGDNDNLSAMVAAAAEADALIICSDVDGLFNKNPNLHDDAELIPQVHQIDASIYAMAGGVTSDVGTGGMQTKIEAAEKATAHGIGTFIINGMKQSGFDMLSQGKNPGTLFLPYPEPMQELVHWMTHTSMEQGEVIIESEDDIDSSEPITSNDVLEIRGEFSVGDTVLLRSHSGKRLAKARANYSSCLLNFITDDEHTSSLATQFEQRTGPILSEKNMAVLEESNQ
ncbi:glutamate 5-kinase [Alteromonadaceae bacterium BrNp21-10]|nr:glutamate 5-kinase [Alteromonadaceae bacterium BrNp21-10]